MFFRYSRDYVVIQIEEFENMEDITIRSSSNVSILFKIAPKRENSKIIYKYCEKKIQWICQFTSNLAGKDETGLSLIADYRGPFSDL